MVSYGFFKRAAMVASLGVGLSSLAGAPAQAQMFGWWGYQRFETSQPQSLNEIRRGLQRQGYSITGPMQRNGRVLLVDAVDPRGRNLRLIVDPVEGEILQRFVNAAVPRPPGDLRNGYDEPAIPRYPDASERQSEPDRAAPRARAKKPQAAPKVAVRSLPQAQRRAKSSNPPPSEATITPRVVDPGAATREPPAAATPREPEFAASPRPESSPRQRLAPPVAAPVQPQPSERPGFVQGVPINPLD